MRKQSIMSEYIYEDICILIILFSYLPVDPTCTYVYMCVYIYADAYPHRHTMGLEIRIVTEIETMYLPLLYHLYTSSFVSSTVHVEEIFCIADRQRGRNERKS